MNITTKFGIGDEVYVLFREDGEPWVKVFTDVIDEIVLKKNETIYYVNSFCEEFHTHELLPRSCNTNELVDKINELLKEDEENGIES